MGSNELLASKVVIQEEEPKIRQIRGAPTSFLFIEGIAEKGPIGTTQVCTSPEEYDKYYGGITANATDLPLAIEGFFENGGQRCYVNRVVHFTDITNVSTKTSVQATATHQTDDLAASAGTVLGTVAETFALVDGDTLSFKIDGGASDVATFNAAAATLTAGNTETYALSDGQTLTVKIDGQTTAQTVTFNTSEFVDIGAATAAEVAAVMNAELTGCSVDVNAGAPRITSDSKGTDSEIEVTGGTANAALGFSTSPVNGTGDAADADAVTVAELKTLVEGDVTGVTVTSDGGYFRATSNTTGSSSSVQVEAVSTMDTKLGLDNATHSGADAGAVDTLKIRGKYDGEYGNNLVTEVTAATSGVASEFNLRVLENGVLAEIFPNVTMDDTASNFVEDIVNDAQLGSELIEVEDLDAAVTAPDDRPVNGQQSLTGGDDGLTGLVDDDYVGSAVSKLGLRAFDLEEQGALLAVPGRATSEVHNAMLTYCAVIRGKRIFAVLDPPANYTAVQIITYVKTTAAIQNTVDSEMGAMYWPRVQVSNPSETIFGKVTDITVAPSGHICGMYARVDGMKPGGVYEAPAGLGYGELRGTTGLETEEVNDEAKRDLIYPELINPIDTVVSSRPMCDGSRTLKEDGNFPTIGERRGVTYIESSVNAGVQWARHRKIKVATRQRLARSVKSFLLIQMRNDAFASDDPATAFFVDFSDALNPPSAAFGRQILGRLGVATAKPADFIIIRVSQDTRALDLELAEAA